MTKNTGEFLKKKFFNGFSLLELLIALLILSILLIISITLYSSYVRKGRRSDAMQSLTAISLAEERYRSTNTQYGTLAQVWGGVTASSGGYYTLSISNTSASAYTITAQAQGDQANDAQDGTSCTSIVLSVSNGTLTKTPAVCWEQ